MLFYSHIKLFPFILEYALIQNVIYLPHFFKSLLSMELQFNLYTLYEIFYIKIISSSLNALQYLILFLIVLLYYIANKTLNNNISPGMCLHIREIMVFLWFSNKLFLNYKWLSKWSTTHVQIYADTSKAVSCPAMEHQI